MRIVAIIAAIFFVAVAIGGLFVGHIGTMLFSGGIAWLLWAKVIARPSAAA